ncbi:MAG TPA: MFS transporter [Ktedonobacteraceae bacterium]|nr:MFS transporter [Ktedonobacteraceae bacterium]
MPTTIEPPIETPEAPQGTASFRRVLKNRNFLLLWLAQLISLTILNAANFGIIVLVNDLTHSVVMAGLAIIAFTLPALPFSAVAGVVVDRLNKRLVLWVSNILRMVTMSLIVLSLWTNRSDLWPLYILTFMTSLIGQFFTPAEGAAIPLVVGERELLPALSLFNITMTLSQAIGFLLLGSLVATLFPPFAIHFGVLNVMVQSIDMLFVLAAFFYLVCAILIFCIPNRAFHEPHLANKVKDTRDEANRALERLWQEIVEGWHYVRNDRILFYSVVQLSVVGNILLLIGELAGPFVQQVLHRPAAQMSIILAPAAIGLVGASIFMPGISQRVGKIRLTVIGFIVEAAGFVLLISDQWLALRIDPVHGAESPLLLFSTLVLVFILGVAMACINIPTQTMMQEHSPEAVRGRIFSLQFMMYNTGSIPILLFAGIFAQFIGFNQLIVLISASMLLFCWWGIRYIRREKKTV